jgi:hypothetical protein
VTDERQPPFTGAVYRAARSRTGRLWTVGGRAFNASKWILVPIGADVRPAQTGNRFNGGVRCIERTDEELRDSKRWTFVAASRWEAGV